MRLRLHHVLTIGTLAASVAAGCKSTPQTRADDGTRPGGNEATAEPLEVKLLAFNDLHGHIEGPGGTVTVGESRVEAGGADYLAARIAEIRKYHPNTAVVAAGDLIGASPLLSALFHDEPTIEALNALGLTTTSVGNHEFDEGVDELKRLQEGGCHPEDGCQDGDPFEGAAFPFLAANVTSDASGETLFPGTHVEEFEGVGVAFIGLTLEDTPAIVSPEGVRGVSFHDEVETINAAVPPLRERGIETIVVLIHEGGVPASEDINGCPGISGPIVDIVKGIDEAVDVVVTGHTHQAYVCEIDGKLVTSAKSYGRLLTEIDLTIDRQTRDVTKKQARNLVIERVGEASAPVVTLIEKYKKIAEPLANQKIGVITSALSREPNEAGESALGKLIADIQLWATKDADRGGAQVAFMNPGGIRASLEMEPHASEEVGVVTYEEAHTVQPFGNSLVTMTLSGKQIHELLEMQWRGDRPKILQVSEGFEYTWRADAPVGEKIDPKSIKLHGEVLDPAASYRVTVNSFLSTGGDGFTILNEGTDRLGGLVDLQAFVRYFEKHSPIAPPEDARIRKQ